jgi:hypothetical protein
LFTPQNKVEQLFIMKIKKYILVVSLVVCATQSGLFAQDGAPKERNQNPVMDATAFGFGTGMYGNYGILGGHLQIGVLDWLRLSGGITGSLAGDQPSGSFAMSNYWFLWQFNGALVFTSTKIYKGIARPYTSLGLTYYYDGKFKAGGMNGSIVVGLDLYMTQDYAIYIEGGINAPFMREALAPYLVGGQFGIGARTFF